MNEKLRLDEIYVSVQGEGPRVGLPTTFVRFAGCNLRCPGWPCDTPHAIYPKEFRSQWRTYTVEEVYQQIIEAGEGIRNVCLTGGEPFLQPSGPLHQLVSLLEDDAVNVEAFTNGYIKYPEWVFEQVDLVMDWKLPGSGEADQGSIVRNSREENVRQLDDFDVIKFTVADNIDMTYSREVYRQLLREGCRAQFYIGPVWGKIEPADVVEFVLANKLFGWRLTVQTHKYIWDPNERKR